jgi:hydrogenase maturation protein HypF
VTGVPYDRPLTTMARFAMCLECVREYSDPPNRRFHAQPVSCPRCGPVLRLIDSGGNSVAGDPIRAAAERLRSGQIVAVKDSADFILRRTPLMKAQSPRYAGVSIASTSRSVMVRDIAAARELAEIDRAEEQSIMRARRPIVLLRRISDTNLAPSVAPANRDIGLMLPYTPIHHLLCAELARPLVLTSGNVSDEPIAYLDADAAERLGALADCFLIHDRPIHIRTDDSVIRLVRGREYLIRRSRSYAPGPLMMPLSARRPILACGAELKSTFCLVKGNRASMSHHIGDLENYETWRAYVDGIDHFRSLFGIEPQVVAHDLHPEYLSTKYAMEREGVVWHGSRPFNGFLAGRYGTLIFSSAGYPMAPTDYRFRLYGWFLW